MSNASVGVVVCTHDRADVLERALKSILAQTKPPSIVVVVDDGTATWKRNRDICASLGSKFVYHRLAVNGGIVNCREIGLHILLRDFGPNLVCMLDDDDVWPLERIELGLAAMQPDTGFSFGRQVMTNAKLDTLMKFPCETSSEKALCHALLAGEFYFPAKTYMFRSEFLSQMRRPHGRFYYGNWAREDIELGIRALYCCKRYGWTWKFVDAVLAYWVQENGRAKFNQTEYRERQAHAHARLLRMYMPRRWRSVARLTAPYARRLPDWLKFGFV